MLRFSAITKAVGFGESHDDGTARTELVKWIGAGLVRDLVLELSAPWEDAGLVGKEYLHVMGGLDKKWKNAVPMAELLLLATEHGVRLHAWDEAGSTASRNKKVAVAFKRHFGRGRYAVTKAARCVVLFGSAHFGSKQSSLNRLLLGLNWTKFA